MARLSQGILGGISGKIGNLVGSSWKGIAVIKTKALSVSNPRTASQLTQRGKMANVVAFATYHLATVIKTLNDRFAQGMSGFNLFVSRNIDLFEDAICSDPSALILSSGKMVAVNPSSLVADVSLNSITVNWPTALPDSYAQATDKAYAICQNLTTGKFYLGVQGYNRSLGTASFTAAGSLTAGDQIALWMSFIREDGSVVSNTGYIVATAIA